MVSYTQLCTTATSTLVLEEVWVLSWCLNVDHGISDSWRADGSWFQVLGPWDTAALVSSWQKYYLESFQHVTKLPFLHSIMRNPVCNFSHFTSGNQLSVLWRCWLGSRKGTQPVKNWMVGCWRGHTSGIRYRFAYGLADATAAHCLLLQ